MDRQFEMDLELVESSIRDAGYVVYDQLYGFWVTGNSSYITRKNGARAVAEKLDKELLGQYLKIGKAS